MIESDWLVKKSNLRTMLMILILLGWLGVKWIKSFWNEDFNLIFMNV